jgi:hypothetical protein
MVTRSHKRTTGDVSEAEAPGDLAELVELGRRQVTDNRQVAERGLEILSQREEVATDLAEIGQCLQDLLGGFSKPQHEPCLGSDVGASRFHVAKYLQAHSILSLAADVLLEPRDCLHVVVEDLGIRREDDIESSWIGVEVGGEDLDRGTGSAANGKNAAAKMVGAAIIEIVSGH